MEKKCNKGDGEHRKERRRKWKDNGQMQILEEEDFVVVPASVSVSICSVLLYHVFVVSTFCGFFFAICLSSPSLLLWTSWFVRERRKEERGIKGERSVFIIEVDSADVLSYLSTHILPLALFSVSFFTSPAPFLYFWILIILVLSTNINVSFSANHIKSIHDRYSFISVLQQINEILHIYICFYYDFLKTRWWDCISNDCVHVYRYKLFVWIKHVEFEYACTVHLILYYSILYYTIL